MKTFDEIKILARHGDYVQVAESLMLSPVTVRQVVNGLRNDRNNIQLAFNVLFAQRNEFNKKMQIINGVKA